MKHLTKAKHFLVMLLAMSLMTACLPILTDEEQSPNETNGKPSSETPETPNSGQSTEAPTPDRELSSITRGRPAHRQNRRSDGSAMGLRMEASHAMQSHSSRLTVQPYSVTWRAANTPTIHAVFSASQPVIMAPAPAERSHHAVHV